MEAVLEQDEPSASVAAKRSPDAPVQAQSAAPKIPLRPKNPERICWGCDKYCPANDLRCGNGTIRTPHPAELFGDDWNSAG